MNTRFIELARQISRGMPGYVVCRAMTALTGDAKAVRGTRVLLLGRAYKADVADMRESPTFELMARFKDLGATVDYHDPPVPVVCPPRKHAKWKGGQSVACDKKTISSYDAVVISTNHKTVNLAALAAWCHSSSTPATQCGEFTGRREL